MEQKERHAVCGNGIVLKLEDYMSKTLEEFEQYLDKMKKYEYIIIWFTDIVNVRRFGLCYIQF